MTELLVLTHLAMAGLGALAVLLRLKPKSTEGAKSMSFIQVIENIGKDIVKVAEFPVTTGGKLVALLKTAQVDGPALVAALDGLVAEGAKVGADLTIEVAADGTNIGEYVAGFNDVKAFFTYFKGTFLPAVEKMIADTKQDFSATQNPAVAVAGTVAAAPAPAVAAVQAAPGLNVPA